MYGQRFLKVGGDQFLQLRPVNLPHEKGRKRALFWKFAGDARVQTGGLRVLRTKAHGIHTWCFIRKCRAVPRASQLATGSETFQ